MTADSFNKRCSCAESASTTSNPDQQPEYETSMPAVAGTSEHQLNVRNHPKQPAYDVRPVYDQFTDCCMAHAAAISSLDSDSKDSKDRCQNQLCHRCYLYRCLGYG